MRAVRAAPELDVGEEIRSRPHQQCLYLQHTGISKALRVLAFCSFSMNFNVQSHRGGGGLCFIAFKEGKVESTTPRL